MKLLSLFASCVMLLMAAMVPGIALGDEPPAPNPWQSRFGQAHPLVGKIWSPADLAPITFADLTNRLAGAPMVLLGEKHDNPDHHRLQAQTLRALIAAGRRPAVLMEMITPDQEPAIEVWLGSRPGTGTGGLLGDAAGLGAALNWEARGWPSWRYYQPIAEAALAAGLKLGAANLSPATAMAIARQGLTVLPPERRHALGLDQSPGDEDMAAMTEEIAASHCRQLPASSLPAMADAQRARDATMAEAMIRQATEDGAVLIAGTGHTRLDRVPRLLAQWVPDRPVLSVGFVEVEDAKTDAAAYGADFDILWFTPRSDERDPCATYAEPLRKLRER